MRGALSAALVLIALQAALGSDEATTRVGRLIQHVADLSRRFIDPSVAAIPDLSAGGSSPDAGRQGGSTRRQDGGGGQDQDQDGGDPWYDPDWAPWNWNLPPGML